MRKDLIDLQNFDNVAAGRTAKAKCDTGPRYHKITLDYKEAGSRVNEATMEASIKNVIVKLNKTEQWRISPARLFDIERSYNKDFAVQDGLIHLYFANRSIEGQLQQESTAIGTLGVTQFSVEVELAAGATSPSLEAYAEIDNVSEAPGIIRKVQSNDFTINSTGDFKDSIARRGALYRAMHFFETSAGDIDNLRMQWEGSTLVDHDPYIIKAMLAEYGYTPQSGQVMLPFDRRVIGDALPSQVKQQNGQLRDASMQLTLNMGAANNVEFVEDFYATPSA